MHSELAMVPEGVFGVTVVCPVWVRTRIAGAVAGVVSLVGDA